jgi:hypothetical protein
MGKFLITYESTQIYEAHLEVDATDEKSALQIAKKHVATGEGASQVEHVDSAFLRETSRKKIKSLGEVKPVKGTPMRKEWFR